MKTIKLLLILFTSVLFSREEEIEKEPTFHEKSKFLIKLSRVLNKSEFGGMAFYNNTDSLWYYGSGLSYTPVMKDTISDKDLIMLMKN